MRKQEIILMTYQRQLGHMRQNTIMVLSVTWLAMGLAHIFTKIRKSLLAIEPMINLGRPDVVWLDDEWTVVTMDGSLSAHYENTILITDGEPEILTLTK